MLSVPPRSWSTGVGVGLLIGGLLVGAVGTLAAMSAVAHGSAAKADSATTDTAPPAESGIDLVGIASQSGHSEDVTTVLLLGDSLMYQTAPVVEQLLDDKAYEVIAYATPGEGLLAAEQEWMLDWVADADRLVKQHDPDIVIAEFVGNYNDSNAVDGSGATIEPRTDAFYEEWLARSEALATVVLDGGATLGWVVPPPMDSAIDPGLAAAVEQISALYRDGLVVDVPTVELVDWGALFAGEDGGYTPVATSTEGTAETVREADGVHFTEAGTLMAAQSLVTAIEQFGSAGSSVSIEAVDAAPA